MGLLDGELATIIGSAVVDAELTMPAVLIKVSPGTRTPGAVSGGTNPTVLSYPVQGIPASTAPLFRAGTLIQDTNRVIRIIGVTLPPGVVPVPGDQITMEGKTSTIVNSDGGKNAVQRDAASCTYLCQCR